MATNDLFQIVSTRTSTSTATGASATPTVDSQSFENNAFTNFAPLLTLFGDEITKQFLSTSMGWPDDILLGIAPIGIMTIIVCAIRIGGNQFLKSFIGRARDSPDDEEKEILSSTSANVREIWDGKRVIRQIGQSQTAELVYNTKWQPGFGLKVAEPLEVALDNSMLQARKKSRMSSKKLGPRPGAKDNGWRILAGKAPNITLHIEQAIPEPWKVMLFMSVGLMVQASVMIINALVVYRWRWLRLRSIVAPYGYPTWAAGTVAIALGVTLCARVVESSTSEYVLLPEENFDTGHLRIIRLQRGNPESKIPAYSINNAENNSQINISKRTFSPALEGDGMAALASQEGTTVARTKLVLTVCGSILTLAGFICQNIGTRELHWSAGVLQLGVTIILAMLRAWLRRHVGDAPNPAPVLLSEDFEVADLISQLETSYCYMPCEWGQTFDDIFWIDHVPLTFPIVKKKISLEGHESLTDSISRLTTGEKAASDARDRKVLRMVSFPSDLWGVEPIPKVLAETASNLCNAIEDIAQRVSPAGNENMSGFNIIQYLMVSDLGNQTPEGREHPSLEGIAPLKLSHSIRETIPAILTLTKQYHRQIEGGKVHYSTLRIIGHCKVDDLKKRDLLQQWVGSTAVQVRSWKRDPDGQIRDVDMETFSTLWKVFGCRYSLAFAERDFTDNCSRQELFVDCDVYERNADEHHIALDFFASFMLDIATQKKAELQKIMGREDGTCDVDILSRVLMKHNVCKTIWEARLGIVPALIAQEFKLRDMPEPDIGLG